MSNTNEKFIVRILDHGEPVGAGFLVSLRHIITCAHVIRELDDEITLDFPLLSTNVYRASVKKNIPVKENPTIDDIEDIAVLELLPNDGLPDEAIPAPVSVIENTLDQVVHMYGFPARKTGRWVSGKQMGLNDEGRIQIVPVDKERFLEEGFSGSAVWDDDVKAVVGMVVVGEEESGGIYTGYMIPASKLAKAWPGLRLKEGDSTVTEPVVEPSGKPPKLGHYHKYTCDRTKQHDQFTKNREKRQGGKVHFFCLHGWDGQSPKGLASRFNFELKKKITGSLLSHHTNEDNDDVHDINVVDSREKEIFKYKLIDGLFSFYKVETDKFAPITKSNLGVVCNNSPILKGSSGIKTVYIRIDTYDWCEFIPDVLEWFVNTFCSEEFLPEGAPEFYFFISLIYEKEDCVDSRKQIIPVIKDKVKGVHVFDEFDEVTKKDIERWLNKHITDIPDKKRREIFSNYFDDEDEYDMDEVEQNLEKIIGIINENK